VSSKLAKWNNAYEKATITDAKPASILQDHAYLLPEKGRALDLACGRAGNAIFLAKRGFDVDAIDFSPTVLKQVENFAVEQNLPINCIERNVETKGLNSDGRNKQHYDVIIVSYFLNRQLFPEIIQALKPNGLLFYQTWSQLRCDDSGPSNADFLLKEGELLRLCSSLRIVYYEENSSLGDVRQGIRNEALIISQKNKN